MQPVGRPLGAVPRSGGRVAFRVRASSNRPAGDRPAAGELRVRAALTLSARQTQRLFQAAEDGGRRPFRYFTDHIDSFFAEATRQGRRRELGFRGEIPDAQARETFERSKLDPSADDAAGPLRLSRGRVTLTADLRNRTVEIAE